MNVEQIFKIYCNGNAKLMVMLNNYANREDIGYMQTRKWPHYILLSPTPSPLSSHHHPYIPNHIHIPKIKSITMARHITVTIQIHHASPNRSAWPC